MKNIQLSLGIREEFVPGLLGVLKSAGAQVPGIKWCPDCTQHPPICFKPLNTMEMLCKLLSEHGKFKFCFLNLSRIFSFLNIIGPGSDDP